LPRELYREKWVTAQFYTYLLGYFALLAGVAMRTPWIILVGCTGLLITALCYNINVFVTISHRVNGAPENTKN
jgi:hypothetical protein